MARRKKRERKKGRGGMEKGEAEEGRAIYIYQIYIKIYIKISKNIYQNTHIYI